MNVSPFTPNFSKTKTIAVTQATASATLDATDSGVGNNVIRLFNSGSNVVFVRWGTGTQTALTTDMPLMPGTVELFTKAAGTDTIAAICASGLTSTLYITCGEGI